MVLRNDTQSTPKLRQGEVTIQARALTEVVNSLERSPARCHISVVTKIVLSCAMCECFAGSGFSSVDETGCKVLFDTELRSCVKVEAADLGSPSLISLVVSVDVKQL